MTTRRTRAPSNHDRGGVTGGATPRHVSKAADDSTEHRIGKRITPQPNGCWLFRDSDDYGCVYIGGIKELTHRYVYELLVGDIPEGHIVHHTCETKACCNPQHLEVMTRSQHGRHHASRR